MNGPCGGALEAAAVAGDEKGVEVLLTESTAGATAALEALCHCPRASVAIAEKLLRGGAVPTEHAMYGAAGVIRNADLTRLLLTYGAEPNDDETPYHAPETYDNSVLGVLLDSGKLNDDSLTTMLLRKADWHDPAGMALLLDHGADPNRLTRWGHTALQQALRRDNHLQILELLLDRGGEPGTKGFAIAARRGRADALELFEKRGLHAELTETDGWLADCARGRRPPGKMPLTGDAAAAALAEFAGNGNEAGVRTLLDSGVPVDARYAGDAYYEIAPDSTALHVASWRARHAIVRLLIDRGASVNAVDGQGRTPLVLAIRACVDSYWTEMRSPQSAQALLSAGASREGVALPTGYEDIDRLLGQETRPAP